MKECAIVLKREKKPAPAICATCGYGPCRNKLDLPPEPLTPEKLADKILCAAGSGLRHYQTRTRDDIITVARQIMEELEK